MALWGAFLRGINLGKRQMKMAELKACLEAAGFAEVKTVLASGNVRLKADGDADAVRAKIEKAIEAQFGFAVGVVLRSEAVLKDIFGASPAVLMELDARDLRLGGHQGFDLVSSAQLTATALRLDGTQRAASDRRMCPCAKTIASPVPPEACASSSATIRSQRAATAAGESPPGQPSRQRFQPGSISRICGVVRPS